MKRNYTIEFLNNSRALFPCGDSMVCIIDDREDVWNMATNLIQVKPYHFFQHTGDINAPPGLSKHELDGKGIDFTEIEKQTKDKIENDKIKSKKNDSSPDKTEEAQAVTEEKMDENGVTPEEKIDEKLMVVDESNESKSEDCPKENEKKTIDEECKKSDDQKSNDDDNKMEEVAKTPDIEIKENLDDIKLVSTPDDDLIVIDDPDDYLLYLEDILKRIHSEFYKIYKETNDLPDLKELVPQIRSKVLVGTNLVFSGLVPNHMKVEQSKAYRIAKSLGANVQNNLNDDTTHLVAVTAGTIKFNTARKKSKIQIVTPDWLWTCAERWERVEEKLFPVDPKKPSKMRQPPAHCHSPGKSFHNNI